MSYSGMHGSFPALSRKWTPHVEFSGDDVGFRPNEEIIPDPYLPTVGVDPFDPSQSVVIAAGRLVSVGYTGGRGSTNYRFLYTDTGKTTMTLHDGLNLTPAGMTTNQVFKMPGEFMTDGNTASYKKGFIAELPYVLSINNAHGTLRAGDKITGYWGSTTSTSVISYIHRGKPVLWNAKTLNVMTAASSATVSLAAAVYPGIKPVIVGAFSASGGTLYAGTAPTLTWHADTATWFATFATAVTEVWYQTGQNADQIAGEVVRIQSLTDVLSRDNFLKWVEYAPQDYLNFPPAAQRFPTTQVVQETPTTVVAGSQYRTVNYPISIYHSVLVEIQGTITDKDGNTTTYSSTWFPLPTGTMLDQRGQFIGLYHDVNWRTGVINLGSNISTVTAIRVSYNYIQDPRDGAAIWGAGIVNLTDGRNVNTIGSASPYGVPAHLNLADVIGAMRVLVY